MMKMLQLLLLLPLLACVHAIDSRHRPPGTALHAPAHAPFLESRVHPSRPAWSRGGDRDRKRGQQQEKVNEVFEEDLDERPMDSWTCPHGVDPARKGCKPAPDAATDAAAQRSPGKGRAGGGAETRRKAPTSPGTRVKLLRRKFQEEEAAKRMKGEHAAVAATSATSPAGVVTESTSSSSRPASSSSPPPGTDTKASGGLIHVVRPAGRRKTAAADS